MTRRSSQDLLSPDLGGFVTEIVDEHREIYCDTVLDDHVNRMCLADSRMFLPGLNLTYTDRASMAASTEVRVPFVDPVVARAAFSLPGTRKDARPAPEGRPQRRCRGLATGRDRQPSQGVVQCTTPGMGGSRAQGPSSTRFCSKESWSRRDSCSARRCSSS